MYKIKKTYYKQGSIFQNLYILVCVCLSVFLVITCTVQTVVLQDQTSKKTNTNYEYIIPKFCNIANTADTVLVSDIFFSLQFMSKFYIPTEPDTEVGLIGQIKQSIFNEILHYDGFYAEAAKRAIDASLYIVSSDSSLSKNNNSNQKSKRIDYYTDNVYRNISPIQYKRILSAKNVIITPLAKVLAYKEVQNIIEYRKRCKKTPIKIPSRTTNGYTSEILRLDYSLAIHMLTNDIIKELQKELQIGNTADFVVIADSAREEVIQDLKIVLHKIKTQVPQATTRIIWKELDLQLESFNTQEQVVLPNSVVLLYTGVYTTQISKAVNTQMGIKKDKIFAILPWQPAPYTLDVHLFTEKSTKLYGIYAKEWVAMPISALFSKKGYAQAKLYRVE